MKLSPDEIKWLFKVLRQVDFLSSYSSEELNELINRTQKKNYPPNTVIITQGEAGKFFFVLYKGKVSVKVEKDTEERIIATLGEADYFGEMALLTGQPCSATVTTASDAEVFSMYPDDFRFVLMNNASLVKSMSIVITKRRTELSEALGKSVKDGDDLLDKMMKFFKLEGKE